MGETDGNDAKDGHGGNASSAAKDGDGGSASSAVNVRKDCNDRTAAPNRPQRRQSPAHAARIRAGRRRQVLMACASLDGTARASDHDEIGSSSYNQGPKGTIRTRSLPDVLGVPARWPPAPKVRP